METSLQNTAEMPQNHPAKDRALKARVAVVGAGIVSPLGFGLEATTAALREARDCVTPMRRFPVDRCRGQTAGQVSDEELFARTIGRSRRTARLSRAARMTTVAMEELLSHAVDFQPELIVIGTTSGGMSCGEEYYRGLHARRVDLHSASRIANYPPQKPVIDAQQAFGVTAPCQIIANACASGTNAIGHAFACVRSGRYKRVLTGGYDAISELVFVGFDSLQAITPEKCRPFDSERTGLVLGEGAALLALENFDMARDRGATILGEIVGYGVSTDNHHLTQPHPSGSGPKQAMAAALSSAGLDSAAIDYINAHGTATPLNDAAEGKAILELLPGVPISSTKSMMGHSLGAAGAVEAIICLLALRDQFLPANINFRAGDPALCIVANNSRPARLHTILSNSFGFGGTNASVILRRAA